MRCWKERAGNPAVNTDAAWPRRLVSTTVAIAAVRRIDICPYPIAAFWLEAEHQLLASPIAASGHKQT